MKHTVIPSVNILIVNNKKLLLSRRSNTGWLDGHLCIPGGHVEKGETPRQAAARELKEELDLDIKIDQLEFLCVLARDSSPNPYVGYEFIIRGDKFKYKNAEPNKCSELVWVEITDLPNDVIDVFRDVINECLIGGSKYLETTS